MVKNAVSIHSLALELTSFCNLRCAHCYNAEHGHPRQTSHDTAQLLARAARVLDAVDVRHATLTGGEPLSHPGCFELLQLLKEHSVSPQLISNGTLIDPTLAERLAAHGVTGVQISLHGPTPPSHDHATGVPGSFNRAVAGVRALQQARVRVTGCVVVTRKNAAQVAAVLGLWRSLGVERVALSRFSPAGLARLQAAALLPSVPDLSTAFEQAAPYARDGMQLFSTMPVPPCAIETRDFAPIRFGSCAIGTSKQEFALGADGALYNCALHRTPLGSVRDVLSPDVDIARLFGAPEVARYRESLPDFCQGCLHARSCGGGCGAACTALFPEGRALPDPLLWQHLDDGFAAQLDALRERSAPACAQTSDGD